MNLRALTLLLPLVMCAAAVEDPRPAVGKIRQEAEVQVQEYAIDWLKRAPIAPVEVPKLPSDPRDSDRQARAKAERYNRILAPLFPLKVKVDSGEALTSEERSAVAALVNSQDVLEVSGVVKAR